MYANFQKARVPFYSNFTPQHLLLCHMGLCSFEFEFEFALINCAAGLLLLP